jgi:hypothetical protein
MQLIQVQAQTPLAPSYVYTVQPNAFATQPTWPEGTYTTLSLPDDASTPVNIGFTFYFYNRPYTALNYTSNANLQFATSSPASNPPPMPSNNAVILPVIAFFWTELYSNTDGYMFRLEGTAPNRRFTVRYNQVNFCCVSGAGPISVDAVLFESTNVIEMRYYSLGATLQPVVIGLERGGGARSDGSYDYTVYWNDLLFNANNAAALQGNTITWTNTANVSIPNPLPLTYSVSRTSSVPAAPTNLTNEIFIAASDENINTIALGFNFVFYGKTYNAINVSANGDIQFETSIVATTVISMPSATINRAPFIAILATNLMPQCSYCRSYGTYGTAPDRVFTLRYKDVPYYAYYSAANPFLTNNTIFFDALLFEKNGTIEIRYYRVPSVSQNVVVGIQGSPVLRADYTYDYTSIVNDVALTSAYTQVHSTTIRYFPTVAISAPPTLRTGVTYNVETQNSVTARPSLTTTALICTDDGVISNVPISFNFSFYDRNFSTLNVGCNGNIQFLTTSAVQTPSALPSGNTAWIPLIALFWTDLNIAYGGSIAYATTGSAPTREFHLRFTDVRYNGESSNSGVTADVVLFESGRFELRYHTVTASSAGRLVSIGTESNGRTSHGDYDFAVIHNNAAMTTAAASNIQSKTYIFTYTSLLPYTPPAPVPLSYTVRQSAGSTRLTLNNVTALQAGDESIATVNLGFFFNFFGRWYSRAQVSGNGEMHFTDLPSNRYPTSFPQPMGGYIPMIAYYFIDLYPVSGEQRVYQTLGAYPNRMFVLRHTNSYYYQCGLQLSFDVILYESNGQIDFRYYELAPCIYSNLLIGIQGNEVRRSDYTYDFVSVVNSLIATQSVVNSLMNTTYTFTPRTVVSPPTPFTITESASSTYSLNIDYKTTQVILSNPVPLPGGYDSIVEVSLGFNFVFYGQTYQRIKLSGHGNVQFTTSVATSSLSAMPNGNSALTPFLAFFMCDLYPTAGLSKMYQTTGVPGYRIFVLRYLNMPYMSNIAATNDIDVLFFEEDNHIEVRYYRISASTGNVLIGIQNKITQY